MLLNGKLDVPGVGEFTIEEIKQEANRKLARDKLSPEAERAYRMLLAVTAWSDDGETRGHHRIVAALLEFCTCADSYRHEGQHDPTCVAHNIYQGISSAVAKRSVLALAISKRRA